MKKPLQTLLLLLLLTSMMMSQALAQSSNYSNWEISASNLTNGKLVMIAGETKTITYSVTVVKNPSFITFNFNLQRQPASSASCGCTAISGQNNITPSDFPTGQNTITKQYTASVTAAAGSSLNGSTLRNGDRIIFAIATSSGPYSPNKAFVVTVLDPPVANNTISNSGSSFFNNSGNPAILNGSTPTGGNGTSYSYQWQSSTTSPTSGFSNIASATGKNFDPPTISQTTYYRRAVTSGTGAPSTSNVVQITIDPISNNQIHYPPNYNTHSHSSSDIPILIGTVPLGSTTFVYKWQMSNNGSTWIDISGATGKDYDPPIITQTTQYRRMVNSINISNTLFFYIYPPIVNNVICCDQTVTNPTPANPLTGTTPSGGSPQKIAGWQSSTDGLNWVGVSGLDEYQPPGGQSGIKFYRRVVSDQAGENISNVVQINFINVIPIGSSFENPFPVGTYNSPDCSYFTQTTNSLDGNFSNQYGDSRNDLFFSFQVNYPHGFPFEFTTCNSGVDTKLYLLDSNKNIIASAENGTWLTLGCGQNSQEADFVSGQLFAGQYYLVVEGNGNLNVNIATALYSDCFDQYPLPFSSIVDESNSPLTRASPQGEDINNEVNLYPNPVIDNVSVSGITDFDVTLYDQSAMSWHVLSHQNGIIDLSGLKKGYYIIKLKNQDQTIIKRIAKE